MFLSYRVIFYSSTLKENRVRILLKYFNSKKSSFDCSGPEKTSPMAAVVLADSPHKMADNKRKTNTSRKVSISSMFFVCGHRPKTKQELEL